jgi:uncharacterized membrane protein YhaH (DUF805 family)
MASVFSFEGRLGRTAYAARALPLLALPYVLAAGLQWASGAKPSGFGLPWAAPLRWVLTLDGRHGLWEAGGNLAFLACLVVISWLAAAAGVRRARDSGLNGFWAALTMVPLAQIVAVIRLAAAPGRLTHEAEVEEQDRNAWGSRIRGLLSGIGIMVIAAGLGALVFKDYGLSLFMGAPFLVGFTTACLTARSGGTFGRSVGEFSLALLLASLILLATAIEGVICLVMAAPFAWLMALVGAFAGHGVGKLGRGGRGSARMAVVLLPMMFLVEAAAPRTASFSDSRSVVVDASPDVVWAQVLNMKEIEAPPSLPFRLGVAYPVRGEVIGEGIGAMRYGYFSTGKATERITDWRPERVLAFDILSEPASIRELSPYGPITTPHSDGYFRSIDARIGLEPVAGGKTLLTLTTNHEMDLRPAAYWLPMARWIVRENKARVLGQMKRQAEVRSRN